MISRSAFTLDAISGILSLIVVTITYWGTSLLQQSQGIVVLHHHPTNLRSSYNIAPYVFCTASSNVDTAYSYDMCISPHAF